MVFPRHSNSRLGLWYNPLQSANKLTAEEETNTLKRIAFTLLAAFFLIPSSAFSQTRGRSSKPKPPTQAQQSQRVAQVRTQGATRVAEQVKNIARFTYLLGGITSTINAVDDAAKQNQVSPAGLQQNSREKRRLNRVSGTSRTGLISWRSTSATHLSFSPFTSSWQELRRVRRLPKSRPMRTNSTPAAARCSA